MSNVLQLLETTAAAFPEKRAVGYREREYTFSELVRTARRLGASIEDRIGSGKPVAVIVERGAEVVLLFLGVLYSGKYYIPLDPEMPAAKLRSILEDAAPQLVLGDESRQELLREIGFRAAFLTGNDLADREAVRKEADEDMPLYMVYTSGSTGKPKGVLKSHGAMMDFIQAFARKFEIGASEIIGNQTPFYFDASAKDLYLMMYTGASLEVIPSELFIFPVPLVEYMNQKRISYVCWVPTALSLVTQMNTFKKIVPEYLKKVLFVGEVFPLKQLKKWMTTLPEISYVNLYGSSELAGVCCYYEITEDPESITQLPMGKALDNCTVFLSEGGEILTNAEQIGEVCVAGKILALEYFHVRLR